VRSGRAVTANLTVTETNTAPVPLKASEAASEVNFVLNLRPPRQAGTITPLSPDGLRTPAVFGSGMKALFDSQHEAV